MFIEKFIRKTKGAISIFMAIVLFSLIIFTGVLIDASRIRSGEGQLEGASDVAANALLTKYNEQLKEFFGLMALSESDADALADDFTYYINRTLMVEGLEDDKAMTGDEWNRFQELLGLSDEKKAGGYMDIYGFTEPEVKVDTLYSLAEPDVLRNQVVDYMKYRAPVELGKVLIDKIDAFKGYSKQTKIYEDKLDVDNEIGDINGKIKKLANLIKSVNKISEKDEYVKNLIDQTVEKVEKKISVELRISELEKKEEEEKKENKDNKDNKEDKDNEKEEKANEDTKGTDEDDISTKTLEELKEMKKVLEGEIKDNLISFSSGEQEKESLSQIISLGATANNVDKIEKKINGVKKAKKDLDSKIDGLQTKIKSDNSEFATQIKDELESYEKKLDDDSLDLILNKVKSNYKMLSDGTDKEIVIKGYKQKNGGFEEKDSYETAVDKVYDLIKNDIKLDERYKYNQKEYIKKYVKDNLINSEHLYDKYFAKYLKINSEEFMGIDEKGKEKIPDPREAGEEIVEDKEKNPANEVEGVDDADKEPSEDLPSEIDAAAITIEKLEEFMEEDELLVEFMKTGGNDEEKEITGEIADAGDVLDDTDFDDEKFAKNAISKVKNMFKALEQGAEAVRDELYVGEYAMGNFKNYLTKEDEEDLRGVLKSNRDTFYDNEIEYILNGSKNEKTNVRLTQSKILLVRFALNTLYIYTDKAKKAQTLASATAICTSFFGFGALATKIVQHLMLMSWAMAESVYDLKQIMGGKSTVLFKTTNTWNLSIESFATDLSEDAAKGLKDKMMKSFNNSAKKVVSYGADKGQDVSVQTIDKLTDMINNRIDLALERVTGPVEDAIMNESKELTDNTDKLMEDYNKKVQDELSQIENEQYREIVKQIYKLAKDHTIDSNTAKDMLNRPKEEALALLAATKDTAKTTISAQTRELIEPLENKTSELINNASKKAYEQIDKATDKMSSKADKLLEKHIDSLGNGANNGLLKKSGTKGSKGNLKSSMVTFNYEDYLRIFMIVTPKTKKILRIGDLIQLNMQAMGNDDFKLSESNTYIRVKTRASMKYIFMTSGLMPKKYQFKGNHIIDSIMYKGY